SADPEKYIRAASLGQSPIGLALYDPVSRMRVKTMPNLPNMTFHGVLYTFENSEDEARFQAQPESFVAAPDKEVLHCPVIGVDTNEPGSAPSYFDADGMRIYLCCYGCINPTKFHAAEYTKQAKATAVKASVHIVTAADLKKEAETFR